MLKEYVKVLWVYFKYLENMHMFGTRYIVTDHIQFEIFDEKKTK
jgi:hypothetical protein